MNHESTLIGLRVSVWHPPARDSPTACCACWSSICTLCSSMRSFRHETCRRWSTKGGKPMPKKHKKKHKNKTNIWGWLFDGDGMGMVWGWYGDGMGMVYHWVYHIVTDGGYLYSISVAMLNYWRWYLEWTVPQFGIAKLVYVTSTQLLALW